MIDNAKCSLGQKLDQNVVFDPKSTTMVYELD